MRLIDANKLSKEIVERGAQLSGCYSAGIARYMDRMLAHVLAEVDNAPTVDAVPVVRCKDCRHWTEWGSNTGSCSRFALDWIGTDADDFCSMAERKDDE